MTEKNKEIIEKIKKEIKEKMDILNLYDEDITVEEYTEMEDGFEIEVEIGLLSKIYINVNYGEHPYSIISILNLDFNELVGIEEIKEFCDKLLNIERKLNEYDEIIEDVREEILESFSIFKKNFYSRLNDTEWSNMQEYFEDYEYDVDKYFEDYEYDVDTLLDEVLEEYYDYITSRYSFLNNFRRK